ncbi:Phi-1-like phosphate-induced protein [Zostera marina]|uniref:Phi-1-like phosphate-induced protein n=1 Tax=Zostera marina TaxID=29655 RepID=A0A0K9PHM1_ZOSMR|nr:Phi-1-like phosphate-induced protein [Zostera marina]
MAPLPLLIFLVMASTVVLQHSGGAARKLTALVEEQPLVLDYHKGLLLKGGYDVNLVWYGSFTSSQKAIIIDFLTSFGTTSSTPPPRPTVASWWKTTEGYKGGSTSFTIAKQLNLLASAPSPALKNADLVSLVKNVKPGLKSVTIVLTSADVAVEGFCSSRCGTHGSLTGSEGAYIWVGNSATQCPGHCAWPFHQPIYGPQTPPLVAPNGDVGVDGMIINLATLLAGTVTNPYGNGYFQGDKDAPLEAVSACSGVFGKGAYPGYPGEVAIEESTGASYNVEGSNGRKYLVPAMWDPKMSQCLIQV